MKFINSLPQKVSRLVIIPNYEDDFVELRSGYCFNEDTLSPYPLFKGDWDISRIRPKVKFDHTLIEPMEKWVTSNWICKHGINPAQQQCKQCNPLEKV